MLAKPASGSTSDSTIAPSGWRTTKRSTTRSARPNGPSVDPFAPASPAGRIHPATAAVIVIATANDHSSMMITAIAIEPTKSPAAPGSSASGMNDSAVVTVEASSGANSRRTESPTASMREAPARSRLPISSVTTMAASTSRPSATMSPVSDICWIGSPIRFIVATAARLTSGSTSATISAARSPSVTSSTATTSATPIAMFVPTSASRSSV